MLPPAPMRQLVRLRHRVMLLHHDYVVARVPAPGARRTQHRLDRGSGSPTRPRSTRRPRSMGGIICPPLHTYRLGHGGAAGADDAARLVDTVVTALRSEEHTSELQSQSNLV